MKWNLEAAVALLEKYTAAEVIPGAALAVVTPEEASVRHVGYAALQPERAVLKPGAIYDLASLTKVVATTTLALQCLEAGCFSLQTTVQSLMPQFPYGDVTIGHLMTHTSGVCADDKTYKEIHGRDAMLRFFSEKPLGFTPGTRVEYSDFGYILLGFLVEQVLEGDLGTLSQSRIFGPLGMADTGYLPGNRGLAGRCVPTELDGRETYDIVHDGKARRLDGISGNAGLFAPAEDLVSFVQMLLGDGQRKGTRILEPGTIGLLKKCYTPQLEVRRTLGWLCDEKTNAFGDYYSDCCIFHTGFTGTSIYVDFRRSCGIILLTNRIHPVRDNPQITNVRNTVHNVLLCGQ